MSKLSTKPSARIDFTAAGRHTPGLQAKPAARHAKELPAADCEPHQIDHGPLAERLGYILRRAQLAIFEDFIAACARYDIRPGQYSVLTVIEQNPGLSQTKVAEALGIKKTNFVAMVDAFERRGLVRRAATPGDRRSYALHLTDAGKILMRKLHRVAEQHESRIVDRIGPLMHKRMFSALAAIATMGSDTGHDE
jgi:DNA-binding MarR family transcriptional regulator